MAHGGSKEDNPVALNVAPMVDIIFCLCIFFMCSFHFKQLEGKIESWLPKKGQDGPVLYPELEEIRVVMIWDAAAGSVVTKIGSNVVNSRADLLALIERGRAAHAAASNPDAPVIIDAQPGVPWKDVVGVLDLCKTHRINKVELAAPFPH